MLNKKFTIFFLILIILTVSIGAVSANDDDPLVGIGEKSFDELQKQINLANASDVIEIEGTYLQKTGNDLAINKSITISGYGDKPTLNGKIETTSANTLFKNLNIIGCIKASNSNLTILNCSFSGYDSAYKAIDIEDGKLTIINSTFSNLNNGIYAGGTLDMDNTDFINCTIQGNNLVRCGFSNINNSRFIDNTLIGGVLLQNSYNNISITKCEFKNNKIHYELASYLIDIFLSDSSTITDSIFINNTCANIVCWHPKEKIYVSNLKTLKPVTFIRIENNIFTDNYDNSGKYSLIKLEPTDADSGIDNKIASEMNVTNNFFGFNIEDYLEFSNIELVSPYYYPLSRMYDWTPNYMKNWINLDLVKTDLKYVLKFIDRNGNIVKMPNCEFSIIDKENGQIIKNNILVKDGIGEFDCDDNLSLDNVYILSNAGEIVNKPKATIEITKVNEKLGEMKFIITLKNGTVPLSNQTLKVNCTSHNPATNDYREGITHEGHQTIKLDENGSCEIRLMKIVSEPIFADYFNITFSFSNSDFGFSQYDINFVKVIRTEVKTTVKPITMTYGGTGKLTLSALIKDTNEIIPELIDLSVGIYKGNKCISISNIYYENGTILKSSEKYLKISDLAAGSYKIVVFEGNPWEYHISKSTATLTVNKAKATVKAPKVTGKYKKSKYFQVTVSYAKKPVKQIYVNVKIDKKTYKLKTNNNGIVKININNLKVGKHKVTITSGNSNYQFSAKSQITIKR